MKLNVAREQLDAVVAALRVEGSDQRADPALKSLGAEDIVELPITKIVP